MTPTPADGADARSRSRVRRLTVATIAAWPLALVLVCGPASAGLDAASPRPADGLERSTSDRHAAPATKDPGPTAAARPTAAPATPTPTPKPKHTPKPTHTPRPTNTPRPTAAPTPTPTPRPTHTPRPTPTPTQVPTATPTPAAATPTARPRPTSAAGGGAAPSSRPGGPGATPGGGRSTGPRTGGPGGSTEPGPSPTPQEAFAIPGLPGATPVGSLAPTEQAGQGFETEIYLDVDFARSVEWLAPAALMAVPALIVMAAFAAQLLGGLVWVPLTHRVLRDRTRRR